MKISKECFVVGTRPDIIKMAPLILKFKPFVIHTGQHYELAEQALEMFNIKPDISFRLMTVNQTLSKFISSSIEELDNIFTVNKFRRVWVQGDTSSALSAAIAAFNNKIDIVHIEAGLRSGDVLNPYPEEIYRKLIDTMSLIKFVPTQYGYNNLCKENLQSNAYVVGNTIVDSLNMIKRTLPNVRPIKDKYVLATIHRRESFGKDMVEIFTALKTLSTKIKVIIPAHPNPNVQESIHKIGLQVIKPLNYFDFLWYLKYCEYIITDSGGIQEEAPSFQKKVIILRKATERQEIVDCGYGLLIPELLSDNILQQTEKFVSQNITIERNPFGDGHSADKIALKLKQYEDKATKNDMCH